MKSNCKKLLYRMFALRDCYIGGSSYSIIIRYIGDPI